MNFNKLIRIASKNEVLAERERAEGKPLGVNLKLPAARREAKRMGMSAAVQSFLEKKKQEEQDKLDAERKKKEQLLKLRTEAKNERMAKAMANRTKDNLKILVSDSTDPNRDDKPAPLSLSAPINRTKAPAVVEGDDPDVDLRHLFTKNDRRQGLPGALVPNMLQLIKDRQVKKKEEQQGQELVKKEQEEALQRMREKAAKLAASIGSGSKSRDDSDSGRHHKARHSSPLPQREKSAKERALDKFAALASRSSDSLKADKLPLKVRKPEEKTHSNNSLPKKSSKHASQKSSGSRPPMSFEEIMALAQNVAEKGSAAEDLKSDEECSSGKGEKRPMSQEEKDLIARRATKEYQRWLEEGGTPPRETLGGIPKNRKRKLEDSQREEITESKQLTSRMSDGRIPKLGGSQSESRKHEAIESKRQRKGEDSSNKRSHSADATSSRPSVKSTDRSGADRHPSGKSSHDSGSATGMASSKESTKYPSTSSLCGRDAHTAASGRSRQDETQRSVAISKSKEDSSSVSSTKISSTTKTSSAVSRGSDRPSENGGAGSKEDRMRLVHFSGIVKKDASRSDAGSRASNSSLMANKSDTGNGTSNGREKHSQQYSGTSRKDAADVSMQKPTSSSKTKDDRTEKTGHHRYPSNGGGKDSGGAKVGGSEKGGGEGSGDNDLLREFLKQYEEMKKRGLISEDIVASLKNKSDGKTEKLKTADRQLDISRSADKGRSSSAPPKSKLIAAISSSKPAASNSIRPNGLKTTEKMRDEKSSRKAEVAEGGDRKAKQMSTWDRIYQEKRAAELERRRQALARYEVGSSSEEEMEEEEDLEESDDDDSFIDDGEVEDAGSYSKYIRQIFKYDRRRYKDDDDDDLRNMESSFTQQMKEEAFSSRMGMLEDLEDIKLEAEALKLKSMKKKKN